MGTGESWSDWTKASGSMVSSRKKRSRFNSNQRNVQNKGSLKDRVSLVRKNRVSMIGHVAPH